MKKVLIIEDDAIVAHIYQTRLEKEGFEVEVAQDGQSGFYRIHEFVPDAVLLDLMLPKMNGVDILKKIRAQAKFARTPIIVFTNAYVPNMVQESFQAGATQVFNKASLTPRQILDAIHTALYFTPSPTPTEGESASEGTPSQDQETVSTVEGEAQFSTLAPVSKATPESKPSQAALPVLESDDISRDEEFQRELLQIFSEKAPETLATLRKCMQDFIKTQQEDQRLPHLLELYRKVHALTSSAGIAGLHNISHLSAALEVLLKELYEKPKNINASTLRTVAHCIDFIAELFGRSTEVDLLQTGPVHILVVDDEILSRRAITYALEKANLKAVSVEEPQMALNLATQTTFDLIFLDVQMPGMDGFELCTKIRALATNRNTAVIFVTSLTDFKSRARSSLSGGNDLIAKPFMFIELSVKALTYVLRGRLANVKVAQAA